MQVGRVAEVVALVGMCGACVPRAVDSASQAGHAVETPDDPNSCVDSELRSLPRSDGARDAVLKQIAGLGECARFAPKPVNILVAVAFRPDGATGGVMVARSSTSDCRAVDCVRQRLAATRAPTSTEDSRVVRADFTLRVDPPPDGNEKVQWEDSSDSKQCTDDHLASTSTPRIPPETIRATVRSQYSRFRQCYELGLARNSGLKGQVSLRFTIDETGRVANVGVARNELADCKVVACLRSQAQTIEFPKSDGPTTVYYPLVLQPG